MLTMSLRYYLSLYITTGICISGSKEVILDCEYNLENETYNGLNVKWFFNSNRGLIYQRIYGGAPMGLRPFKEHLDLEYGVSHNSILSHTALRILNPTVSMSGEYFCLVSTFEDEDFKSGSMLVYSTGKNFKLHHEKKDDDSVNVVCTAEDVYPQPVLKITKLPGSNFLAENIKTNVILGSKGLFDINATVELNNNDLNGTQEFLCHMKLKSEANYTLEINVSYVLKKIDYPETSGTKTDDLVSV